jgi:hypothetical protein
VPGDRDRHEADRAAAGDEHVLDEREGQRGVHGVAERVEDRAELGRHIGVVHPDVRGGKGEVLRIRAVALHAESDRADAHLPAAGAAVAAHAAHDVPLAGDAVADRDVVHQRAHLDDLAVELVPGMSGAFTAEAAQSSQRWMCRSVPQMPVRSTRMTTSSGPATVGPVDEREAACGPSL